MAHHQAKKQCVRVGLLAGVVDRISERQLETLSILADVNQMSDLMNSLLEARSGRIVSLDQAFSDL